MFRHLIMAIFRLYMNHLVSSYTNIYIYIYGLLIWWRGGCKVGTRSRICQNGWDMWDAWRVHAVIKLCLSLIIDKSMVGIIQCLIVLRTLIRNVGKFISGRGIRSEKSWIFKTLRRKMTRFICKIWRRELCRWADNTKIDHNGNNVEGCGLGSFRNYKGEWPVVVKTEPTFGFGKRLEICWTAEQL